MFSANKSEFSKIQLTTILSVLVLLSLNRVAAEAKNNATKSSTNVGYPGKVEELNEFKAASESLRDAPHKKRNVITEDLRSSATAKTYEPPPEFYRGPGSTSSDSSYSKQDSAPVGFISKPVTFPDTNVAGRTGQHSLSNEFNKWQLTRNSFGSYNGYNGIQDRISVGHYGPPASTLASNTQQSNGGAHSAYAYDGHSYEYPHGNSHYGDNYGGAGGAAASHFYGHSSSAESGIPFDVYGSKGHYGGGGAAAGVGGGGGEYAYVYPVESHEPVSHKGSAPEISQKALLAKSFLIPLASAAVLGIAAALVSNPLLLQLGTVSGIGPTVVGRRRRRRDIGANNVGHRWTSARGLQRAYRAHSDVRA